MASLAEENCAAGGFPAKNCKTHALFLMPGKLSGGSWLLKAPENSLLNQMLYCNRAISRNCRAVASRNVSMLVPEGASSPDLAWIAEAIRCARA